MYTVFGCRVEYAQHTHQDSGIYLSSEIGGTDPTYSYVSERVCYRRVDSMMLTKRFQQLRCLDQIISDRVIFQTKHASKE